eukprot:scaffold9726_cov119-Isochrysis_galbana.AAC.8
MHGVEGLEDFDWTRQRSDAPLCPGASGRAPLRAAVSACVRATDEHPTAVHDATRSSAVIVCPTRRRMTCI